MRWIAVSLALAAAGCSSFSVGSDHDPSATFDAYRTWDWVPSEAEWRSLLDRRIRDAVETSLAAKGYRRAGADPDFLLGYVFHFRERIDVDSWGRDGFGWRRGGFRTHVDVRSWTEGTIVLDVLDPGRREMVWRGWATGAVDPPEGPDPERVREAVAAILERFPPRP